MDSLPQAPPDPFSDLEADGRIEVAALLRRNGQRVAFWSRRMIPPEVVTIMAATTLGSLETLVESVRDTPAQTVAILSSGLRLYLQKVEPSMALLLIASDVVAEASLKDIARRIVARIPPPAHREASRRVVASLPSNRAVLAEEGHEALPSSAVDPRSSARFQEKKT